MKVYMDIYGEFTKRNFLKLITLQNRKKNLYTFLGLRTIAPEENYPPVRVGVRTGGGQFSSGTIVLEPHF